MAFDKNRSAGYLANHMARLFAVGLQERIRPLGIAPAQFMVMLELWREDGLSQRELVERLDVEQATMANTLARMQRDGLIARSAHEGDVRIKRIHLTKHAREIEDAALSAARAQNQAALKDLSADEQGLLVDLMRRVIGAMRG